MKLENLFVGGTLVFLIFALSLAFYADLLKNYNVSESLADDFRSIEEDSGEIYSASVDMKKKTQDKEVSGSNAEDEMYVGMQAGIRGKPYTVTNLMGEMLHIFGKQVGLIPTEVLSALGAIITILTVFAVLYFIRGIQQLY